jgi:DNA gyrase subunit A
LVVSEKGFGKRTPIDEYRITNRGGKGVKTINVTDKTGSLVGLLDVMVTEDLMITCKSGVTIRMPVKGVSEQGRATQGVKLIRLDDGDEIAAITKLDDENGNAAVIPVTDVNGGAAQATNQEDIASVDMAGDDIVSDESAPDDVSTNDELSPGDKPGDE